MGTPLLLQLIFVVRLASIGIRLTDSSSAHCLHAHAALEEGKYDSKGRYEAAKCWNSRQERRFAISFFPSERKIVL